MEQEKLRLIEDYQKQLQQVLKDKDAHQQQVSKLENSVLKLEGERDRLTLKHQQGENQVAKIKAKLEEVEQESRELQSQL